MKYSLIISAVVLGISIATASCKKPEEVKVEKVEDAQANAPKLEKYLSVWSKLLNDINERLSKIENNFQINEKQHKKFNRNNENINDMIAKLAARIDEIEKISSLIEVKNILKSFKGTDDVLKKRLSEIAKKLEDTEVKFTVLEKLYDDLVYQLK